MMLLATTRPAEPAASDSLEFTARLWLRTALLAWLAWLVPLALVLADALRF